MAATEEPIVEPTEQEVASAPVVEDVPAEENHVVEEAGGKAKKTKAKKPAAPRKRNSTHPPYFEMMSEAITTLKERNGSSQHAIQKFIEEKHKNLPSNFRKLLLVNLKKFVASGRLVKVKGSFKLPSTRSAAPKPESASSKKPKATAAATKAKTKTKSVAKPKTAAAKPKTTAAKPKAKAKL